MLSFDRRARRTQAPHAEEPAQCSRALRVEVITTAGFDALRDDGAAYAGRVNDCVPVACIPMTSMLHGFFALLPSSVAARDEFAPMVNATRLLLDE
jgi:acetyl esterase/lipase